MMVLSTLRNNTLLGLLLLYLVCTLAIPTGFQEEGIHNVIEKQCGGCGCTGDVLLSPEPLDQLPNGQAFAPKNNVKNPSVPSSEVLRQFLNEQIETIEKAQKEALEVDDIVRSDKASPVEQYSCGSKGKSETCFGCQGTVEESDVAMVKQCSCGSEGKSNISRRNLPRVVGYENGPIDSVKQIGGVETAHIRRSIDTDAISLDSNAVQQTAEGQLRVPAHNERQEAHYIRHSDNSRIHVEYPEELQQTTTSGKQVDAISRRHTSTASPPNANIHQPSMGDWWAIDGPAFLRTYITNYGNSNFTAKHGLFGGLAHCYGLAHGSNVTHTSECDQVRKTVGTEDNEQATFALTSLKNFVTLTDLVHV